MKIASFIKLLIIFVGWTTGDERNISSPPNYSNQPSNVIKRCKEKDKDLDIAFVLDCTTSMNGFNQAVREKLELIMNQLKNKTRSEVRKAIITYTDMDVGTKGRFNILPFHTDTQKVIDHITKFCMDPNRPGANGQSHTPEDVTGALSKANKLPWKAPNRVIFHITDAPGHHQLFGNSNYPNGKQGDPQPWELLTEMNDKMIHYVLGATNPTELAKMVDWFENYANNTLGNPGMIKVLNMQDTSKINETILIPTVELINKNCEKKAKLSTAKARKLWMTTPTIIRSTQAITRIVMKQMKPKPILNINDIKINL